jgi:hypothetical protein
MIGPFLSSPQLNRSLKLKPKAFSIASLISRREGTVEGLVTNEDLEDCSLLVLKTASSGFRDGIVGESVVLGRGDIASCI